MTATHPPTVFIAVPVFQGEAVVAETLASIAAQSWPHWRATIAIDGGDTTSSACCRPFLADPRFTLVTQPNRLGWAGNLNALMDRCDGDYFVYWQQDDVCDTNYLETLVEYAEARPEAACSYADVQWFGARTELDHLPSILGTAFERVRAQLHGLSYLPFRGLIRAATLAAVPRLRIETAEAAFEDLVWSVHLARAGALHAVDGTRYFKRAHANNTHGHWLRWPSDRLRSAWMACAVGAIEAAWPAVPHDQREASLLAFVERFVVPALGRGLAFDASVGGPAAMVRLGREILREARVRLPQPRPAQPASDPGSWFEAALRELDEDGATLAQALLAGGAVSVGADSSAVRVLGIGWSLPEPWGTWTHAPLARIELPALDTTVPLWITLDGQPFLGGMSPGDRRRMVVSCGAVRQDRVYGPDEPWQAPVVVMDVATARHGGVVSIEVPDAQSPAAAGLSPDPRPLGLALTTLQVSLHPPI